MIPQPFVKGAGERVFFGPYEYPPNADIVFDFGNSICTSAFNSSRIVYNAGTANVTGSLIPYANPGNIYPTLETTNGGTMVTQNIAFGTNYLQWDYSSSVNQTSVSIFKLNGTQLNPWNSYIPSSPTTGGSDIQLNVYGNTIVTGSASLIASYIDNTETLNVDVSNGRNGYNIISAEANGNANLFVNQTLVQSNSVTGRTNDVALGVKLGYNSNMRIMAYLQYPYILSAKQIRQINKVFSVRYFT